MPKKRGKPVTTSLLTAKNNAESRALAIALMGKIAKAKDGRYVPLANLIKLGINFQQSPTPPAIFAAALLPHVTSHLSCLVASYLWVWHISASEMQLKHSGLAGANRDYVKLHAAWFAAEIGTLISYTSDKQAKEFGQKAESVHAHFRTRSMVKLAKPVPHWQMALAALRTFSGGNETTTAIVETTADERMIWVIDCGSYSSYVIVRPLIQKCSSGGWTKGRPVSLERLFYDRNEAAYSFLDEKDLAICSALDTETNQNHYGYRETTYEFDCNRLARAIIGHPRIFRDEDRERPIEVVEVQPQLLVKRIAGNQLQLTLDPKPNNDSADSDFKLLKQPGDRIGIVIFTKDQVKLHKVLNGTLVIPAEAEQMMMESIQPLAKLVSIHSEVETTLAAEHSVAADASPHLHAVPYESGLQLTFHVRPFGSDGPYFQPGEGALTVVAKIGAETMATKRDLQAETDRLMSIICRNGVPVRA